MSVDERMSTAIEAARSRGHVMTQSFDNGNDFLMSICRTCGMVALASERLTMGRALAYDCEHVKPVPTPTAPPAPASHDWVKPTWALRDWKAIDKEDNFIASRNVCEYCGGGSTIVGRTCHRCSGADKSLAHEVIRRGPKPFIRTDRDKHNVLHAIAPEARHTGGRIWYRYGELHPIAPATSLTAPCGKKHEVAVVYFPRDYDPNSNMRPDRFIQYCCHEECHEIRVPKNRIIEDM